MMTRTPSPPTPSAYSSLSSDSDELDSSIPLLRAPRFSCSKERVKKGGFQPQRHGATSKNTAWKEPRSRFKKLSCVRKDSTAASGSQEEETPILSRRNPNRGRLLPRRFQS